MANERIKIIKYESTPAWDTLEIKSKWSEWAISSDSNNDVEIMCDDLGVSSNCLILNQDELKQVIEFLQSKVIK